MTGFLAFLGICAAVGMVAWAANYRTDADTEWYWSDDD